MEGKMPVNSSPFLDTDSKSTATPSDSGKRLYQVWKGNNRFFLGGRLVFGPDVKSLVLTVSLIVTPVILFIIFVSQRLIHEYRHYIGHSIVAFAVLFTLLDICLLFLTSGRDPGIIPRNEDPTKLGFGDSVAEEMAINKDSFPRIPPTKDILVNGVCVRVKYCHTCMIYRPPRCSHCSFCNNCVDRFDHHCPWIGQCVAKRNYHLFFMFISSTTLLCFYVFFFCWVNIKNITKECQCSLWKALMESPVSGILILYTFLSSWFVGGLTVFHIYLICTNQTTYENFRNRYDGKSNPFNRGCARNCIDIFFKAVPKSRNNFRARVEEVSSARSRSFSMVQFLSPTKSTASFDVEMGGQMQTVYAGDFEDMKKELGLEQCRHQLGRSTRGEEGNWEVTSDILSLATEFGMELGLREVERSHSGRHFSGPSKR